MDFQLVLVLLFVSAYYLQQDLGQQARVFQMVASVSVRGKVVPPFCDGREHCSPHVCSTEIFNVCQQFHFVTLNQHELQSKKMMVLNLLDSDCSDSTTPLLLDLDDCAA